MHGQTHIKFVKK